jgi:hypothetical protein
METLIDALGKTPLPTILVVAGIIFLFLAIGGQLGARFSSERLKPLYAFAIGLILLGAGVSMQMIQVKVNSAQANKDKLVTAQASPTPTTAPEQTYSLRGPVVKGKVIRMTIKMDMPEVSVSLETGGKYTTGSGSISIEKTERIEVMALEGERSSVMREKILSDTRSATVTVEGQTSNNTQKGPLEGATMLMEYKNGQWVRSLMGNVPNQAQKAELQQQFVDPDEIYPTDKVSPGYKWQLKDYQLAHFFPGVLSATGDAWCTFTDLEMHQDRKCAVISSWLQISYKALVDNNPAEINLGASSTTYRALDKLVDIESRMDGHMTMKWASIVNGLKTTMEMAGSLHAVGYVTDITDQPDF